MSEQGEIEKIEKTILDLNRNGLNNLSSEKTYPQSIDYLRQAQRIIQQELKPHPDDKKLSQLAAITYNNLACYYKKNNKPKVALSYLKKALEIEVFKVFNWTSTASTHLNICAIYSFLKQHQEAAEHALLSLKMLEKCEVSEFKNNKQEEKMYWNIKMLANYNSGVELQYIKKYDKSLQYFKEAKDLAQQNAAKNAALLKTCTESIERVEKQKKSLTLKLAEIISKRKEQEIKGNHQFMRRNKKNYQNQMGKDDWRAVLKDRKYIEYKTELESSSTKKHQSAGKLQAIKLVTATNEKQSSRGSLHGDFTNRKKLSKV